MQTIAFYHAHLEQVSRSFSFCIMRLLSPAREWVALGYLLCRVADVIEDSVWSNKKLQYHIFEQFRLFLEDPSIPDVYNAWLKNFPEHIPLSEKNLLADLPLLLNDLQELPAEVKNHLVQTLYAMMRGMMYFLERPHSSLETTNHYCFFVAGIIGAWLTQVFSYFIAVFKPSDALIIQSFHFGLFLQKINILKDQLVDESAGRYYVASRELLRESLIVNAQQAFNYLQAIPIIPGRTYRLFCAWSLFIGLASLKWIDKSWQMQELYKISGKETRYLVQQIEQVIDDNTALEDLFKRYLPHAVLKVPCNTADIQERLIWLAGMYPHNFSENEAFILGF